MEIQTVQPLPQVSSNEILLHQASSFIESNTKDVSLSHLEKDCIIPVFSKDNETTISHQEFINIALLSTRQVFAMEKVNEPQIRVSHDIRGRIPQAIGKPAKELLEHEKTIYYERAAFIIEIPTIKNTINGNELNLMVGGVRAYNQENLYSKKTIEKFKVFIGFKNLVCCNLCVSTDGYISELRASNVDDLLNKIVPLFEAFNLKEQLTILDSFADYEITQHQFCQFIGRCRLYHFLPKKEKQKIPYLALNDGQISAITKAYYEDENFSSNSNGYINLWKLYNLFTGAAKSSYIDNYVERTVNSYELTKGLISALNGEDDYKWFLE